MLFLHLFIYKMGGRIKPIHEQIIQSGFQSFVIIKSLGVGLMGCFLAVHQNFKVQLL